MCIALVLLAVLFSVSSAKLVNVTIDDAFGDPVTGEQIQYTPSNAWQRGDDCGPCTAKPVPASNAWMGTWHDATFNPNDTSTNSAIGQDIQASVQFTGTAVYVNCILTRSFTSPDGNTDMTFFLDDMMSGVFQLSPDGTTAYYFDVPVFSKTDLSDTQHTLRLEAGLAGQKALVLLDSIIYTMDDSEDDTSTAVPALTSSSPASSQERADKMKKGLLAGLVVVTVVIIGFTIGFFIYLKRGRSRNEKILRSLDGPSMITPFEKPDSYVQYPPSVPPIGSSTYPESVVSYTTDNSTSSIIARVDGPTRNARSSQRLGLLATTNARQPHLKCDGQLEETTSFVLHDDRLTSDGFGGIN